MIRRLLALWRRVRGQAAPPATWQETDLLPLAWYCPAEIDLSGYPPERVRVYVTYLQYWRAALAVRIEEGRN